MDVKLKLSSQRVINLRITLGLLDWETSLSTEFPTHNLSLYFEYYRKLFGKKFCTLSRFKNKTLSSYTEYSCGLTPYIGKDVVKINIVGIR